MKDWKTIKYQKVYNNTIENIESRKQNEPDFDIKKLEQILETEYMNENMGNNSEIAQITLDATIAALQASLAEWKKESGKL